MIEDLTVLLVNPNAGRASEGARAEIVSFLEERCRDLRLIYTTGRDDATELAAKAVADGAALVVAFGGDGHVNEVVNGVAGSDAALGIIPGGTMNVFARSLGIPRAARAAAERLAELDPNDDRAVNLGRMDDRLFTFAAGCGFDAEAARLVERDPHGKRRFGEPFFYWSAARVLMGAYRRQEPEMTVTTSTGRQQVAMAIACNTRPYAYLGGRAVELTPDARLDAALDLFALKRMRSISLPRYAWTVTRGRSMSSHPDARTWHDIDEATIEASEPFPRHVDGESLGPTSRTTLSIERHALRIRA